MNCRRFRPSQAGDRLLKTSALPGPKRKWPTSLRGNFAFCDRIFSACWDAEHREALRYLFEKVVVPIGAQCRHDLRLELLYLYKMYGPDTPFVFISSLAPQGVKYRCMGTLRHSASRVALFCKHPLAIFAKKA
jgi:hypothetical protein